MRKFGLLLLLGLPVLLSMRGTSAEDTGKPVKDRGPEVYVLDPEVLRRLRREARDGKRPELVKHWRRLADKAMKQKPPSVTQKPQTPPSGDKHDYMSLAIYWWPNPITRLPYYQRDGHVNPEVKDYDAPRLGLMQRSVRHLAVAWWLTGEETYAAKAAEFLRVWFIDPKTRMNPHLKFGQGVPGLKPGNRWGIIETGDTALRLIDAVGLLAESESWTEKDDAALQAWFRDYLEWLRTSKLGREEAATRNNHGFYYDLQIAVFACYVGEQALAKQVLSRVTTRRIDEQIEPDGRMPRELARTKSFDYSVYNLRAIVALASVAQKLGIDLWHYRGPEGQGIRRAIDYLAEYARTGKPWPHDQLGKVGYSRLVPLLVSAAEAYDEPKYAELAASFKGYERRRKTSLEAAGRSFGE